MGRVARRLRADRGPRGRQSSLVAAIDGYRRRRRVVVGPDELLGEVLDVAELGLLEGLVDGLARQRHDGLRRRPRPYLLCQPEPKIQASLYLLFLPESVRYPTVPGKIYRHGSARGRKGRGRVLPYKLVAARWRRVAGRRIACQCWLRLPLEWLRRFIDASDACAGGLSCGSRLGAFGCQGCSRARGTLLTENKGRSTAFG